MQNFSARKKRATKTRARIKASGKIRLSIHRTVKHIYAQVIDDHNGKIEVESEENVGTTFIVELPIK